MRASSTRSRTDVLQILLEISLFADESGESGTESKYYLLTLVFHEQDADISRPISIYENDLRAKGLPNIPLHACPLMNGHDGYEGMDIQGRMTGSTAHTVASRKAGSKRYARSCYRQPAGGLRCSCWVHCVPREHALKRVRAS